MTQLPADDIETSEFQNVDIKYWPHDDKIKQNTTEYKGPYNVLDNSIISNVKKYKQTHRKAL